MEWQMTTNTKTEIVRAIGADWEGIYVNGKLAAENNELGISDLINVLEHYGLIDNIAFYKHFLGYEDNEKLDLEGSLPKKLIDLQMRSDDTL
jgi:asparagine synthetase B (glutamine-hydrolysing)